MGAVILTLKRHIYEIQLTILTTYYRVIETLTMSLHFAQTAQKKHVFSHYKISLYYINKINTIDKIVLHTKCIMLLEFCEREYLQ